MDTGWISRLRRRRGSSTTAEATKYYALGGIAACTHYYSASTRTRTCRSVKWLPLYPLERLFFEKSTWSLHIDRLHIIIIIIIIRTSSLAFRLMLNLLPGGSSAIPYYLLVKGRSGLLSREIDRYSHLTVHAVVQCPYLFWNGNDLRSLISLLPREKTFLIISHDLRSAIHLRTEWPVWSVILDRSIWACSPSDRHESTHQVPACTLHLHELYPA